MNHFGINFETIGMILSWSKSKSSTVFESEISLETLNFSVNLSVH